MTYNKLTSRKLWVLLGITAVMVSLNYLGMVTSSDLTNWFIFGYGTYATANAAGKFVGNK